ncbi:hypothetical protein Tco_0051595 [Tanacetum coccineum]
MSTQSSSNQIEIHFPYPDKSLQFRQVEESESDNLFHNHIQGEDENAEDVQMADHLRPMEELLRIPIVGIENAIVVPAVLANEFELKTELLDFVKEAFQERPLGVLPSDTEIYPQEEHKAVTTMSGLTLDGSFIPHFNFLVYQDEELEPETITEVVGIASSQSTPLVPPPETPRLSTPKLKENLKPNPHQPLIPYPSRLKKENFQALENPTGRADHFVYRIDIVDSLCGKFPIENNSMSGNPTPPSDSGSSFPPHLLFPTRIVTLSVSTTSHSDYSLPDYDAFYFNYDYIEEKSSGSTTTHSDFSLPEYDSFIFDISIDLFPPADRSAFYHEEFADELAHIISPPEYDYFYFDLEADPGEFTRVLKENIFDLSTKGLTINELNDSSLLLSDYDSSLSKEFSEMDLLVSFPSRNEDIIFDPRIIIIKGVQSERLYILPLDDFSTNSFVSDSLLLTDPSDTDTFLLFLLEMKTKFLIPEFSLIMEFSLSRENLHIY